MSLKRVLSILAMSIIVACAFPQTTADSSSTEEAILGTTSPDLLIMRGDVRDDLQLTPEQSVKILSIQTNMEDQTDKTVTPTPAEGEEGPDTTYEAMRRYAVEQVDEILTPEQLKRLKQISLQLTGFSMLARPDLQKQVDLSKDLQIQIYDLTNEEHRANDSVLDKYQAGDLTIEQVPGIIKKNHQLLNDEIAKILPISVKDKFKALGGKPFKPATTL